MDYNRSIVVVGEENNQAKLVTQLEPIRLSQNKHIAVKSIFHGTVYNINNDNNKIHYQFTPIGKNFYDVTSSEIIENYFAIPEGNYPTTQSVIEAIVAEFDLIFPSGSRIPQSKFEAIQSRKKDFIKIDVKNLQIKVANRVETPWNLLNILNDITEEKTTKILNIDFSKSMLPTFLYVNIVENSYINGKLSRNLSTIPLNMKRGWSFYEFKDPIYAPIDVQEFSKIILEIPDMNGNYVTFYPLFRTVMTLHISTINSES